MNTITLKFDKERTIKYGMYAIILLEKALGKPIASFADGRVTFEDIITMLMFGLRHEDNTLNVESTANLFDIYVQNGGSFNELSTKVMSSVTAALGTDATPKETE